MHVDCAELFAFGQNHGRGGSLVLEPVGADFRHRYRGLHLGTFRPEQPVVFRVQEKRMLGDVVGTSAVAPLVVSAKVLTVLSDEGFTGWSSFPIQVTGATGEQFDGYRGLSITGRSGPIDDSLSERVVLPPYVPGAPAMPHRRGFCPVPGSWDGSDLFVPEGTSYNCVTSPVRDALVAAGLVGASFQRMSEITVLVVAEGDQD